LGSAHASNCRGAIAQMRGQLDVAEAFYREAAVLATSGGDLRLDAMVERNLGIIASIRGEYDRALDRFMVSLRKAEHIDDEDGQSRALNNIAMVYAQRRQYPEANGAYTLALHLAQKRGDLLVECACRIHRAAVLIADE